MACEGERILLNDGWSIPQLGFGCFQVEEGQMDRIIRWAVEAGYRYFDGATRYENEEAMGRALGRCGVDREKLYVVSKMWPSSYDEPVKAVEYSLGKLNLGYIDAYYLHWPSASEYRRLKAWETLLDYREKGLIRSVGVSNFTEGQVEGLIEKCGVVPTVNQIELHPWYPQRALADYCRKRNIAVTAWGPIFRGRIEEAPLMETLAFKYGKSAAQVTLRWHIQHGNIVIPKSSKRERIIANAMLYDFELSGEDMAAIDGLECGRHFGADPLTNEGLNFSVKFYDDSQNSRQLYNGGRET